MICKNCLKEIEIRKGMTMCTFCGGDISLEVNNWITAQECIDSLIKDGKREELENLLLKNKRQEANQLIIDSCGVCDRFIWSRIIKIIMQTTENEELQKHTAKAHADREWKKNHPQLTHCTACGKEISIRAQSCPNCGNPTGVCVCPKCNGINTKAISGASKATSVFLWGAFAANKVVSKFQCKDCGHKF